MAKAIKTTFFISVLVRLKGPKLCVQIYAGNLDAADCRFLESNRARCTAGLSNIKVNTSLSENLLGPNAMWCWVKPRPCVTKMPQVSSSIFDPRPLLVAIFMAALMWPGISSAKQIVSGTGISGGTIVISMSERRLYLGLGNGKAVQYPVGVGKRGRQWTGNRYIKRKAKKPAWRATPDILKDKPNLTEVIPGGSPRNPMGAAALLISGSGQYAIHGTNRPESIGGYVSYGCIRMHNRDIMDLYSRVGVGTRVIVRQ